VETVLLKNECDYISVEQRKDSTRRKRRDENMKQLLDVTNRMTLTAEDVRDSELR